MFKTSNNLIVFETRKARKLIDNRGERVKLNSKIVIVGEALFAYKPQHYTLGWSAPRRTHLFLVSKTFHRGYAVQAYHPCIGHFGQTLRVLPFIAFIFAFFTASVASLYRTTIDYLQYLNYFYITIEHFFLLNKLIMLYVI